MSALFVVSLWGCSGPGHMVEKNDKPDIMTVKADPGKSAIVIARTTNFGGAIEFDTYLDEKMIGVTKKKVTSSKRMLSLESIIYPPRPRIGMPIC